MAQDINCVTLVGRLTRDCEIKYTQGGMAITRFSIAVNRTKRTDAGWEDEANFFNISLFGKLGPAIERYLAKGAQVAINGELRQSRYEVDGEKRSSIEVIANNVQLLSSMKNEDSSESRRTTATKAKKQVVDMDDIGPEEFDDDIPF